MEHRKENMATIVLLDHRVQTPSTRLTQHVSLPAQPASVSAEQAVLILGPACVSCQTASAPSPPFLS